MEGLSVWQLDSVWKNQKGREVRLSQLAGESQLVVMLYTHCETACPLIVEDLKQVAQKLKASQKVPVGVTIFSIDPQRDTPTALAAFAKKRKLPVDWQVLTSNDSAVAELAAALGFRYKRLADGEYIHSNVIFLMDRDGVVVARKEGLKTPAEDFLKKAAQLLHSSKE